MPSEAFEPPFCDHMNLPVLRETVIPTGQLLWIAAFSGSDSQSPSWMRVSWEEPSRLQRMTRRPSRSQKYSFFASWSMCSCLGVCTAPAGMTVCTSLPSARLAESTVPSLALGLPMLVQYILPSQASIPSGMAWPRTRAMGLLARSSAVMERISPPFMISWRDLLARGSPRPRLRKRIFVRLPGLGGA